jgi:hypothetical protein
MHASTGVGRLLYSVAASGEFLKNAFHASSSPGRWRPSAGFLSVRILVLRVSIRNILVNTDSPDQPSSSADACDASRYACGSGGGKHRTPGTSHGPVLSESPLSNSTRELY